MVTRDWATRFYGMDIAPDVAAAVNETLTDAAIVDLVDAHLGINRAYFGAIDKTLSGFVVLDDRGDDYTLLDVRDGGQVYWQDHETRDLELRHDSFAEWQAHQDGVAETPKLVARGTRSISSATLCARYQWLVWLLARPSRQTAEDLVRAGIGRLRHIWPRREMLDAAFEIELGLVGADPHLAIYWLLHTTAVADHARRARVVEKIDSSNELARAFVARLGELPLAGDVAIVPEFRARRALVQTYGETELAPDDVPRACLLALQLGPYTSSLVHALQVTSGLERGVLSKTDVVAAMSRIPEITPGVELVRAVLDKRTGQTASPHADTLAKLVVATLRGAGEPWWFALEAMWQVHELAYDPALHQATTLILACDRYHRRALQMAMRAAMIVNAGDDVIDQLESDLGLADAVIDVYRQITEHPRDWQTYIASLETQALHTLAWRILQRVAINPPSAELAAWAAQQVANEPAGIALVGEAFAAVDAQTRSEIVGAIAGMLDGPSHPLVGILLACIDGPESDDHATQYAIKRAKGAALIALAPWFESPQLFERLIQLAERPASGTVVELLWAKLFSPSEKASYVVGRLDAAQAERAAKALISTQLRHPSIHARNAAGHQLYRFSPVVCETFLVDALTEYGARFAAAKGPGGTILDHGKTENDQLEDLVANLYAAVRGLGTPSSREALVERLFEERRAYWRLGSAIGDVWTPELHARVMALLAERKDARAAGAYAYAVHDFVKKGPPLVDLARLVREWQGDTEVARGFLHYALVVGIDAALNARDYELVRLAHENAAWIAEPPIEPDAHTRGRTWLNPLETENQKALLAAALSGAAATERDALRAAAKKARAAKKPNKKITFAELGQLGNTQVYQVLLHDPTTNEIWFKDSDHAIRYFDGYDMPAVAPFTARMIGGGGVPELAAATAISERGLWWSPRVEELVDAVRLGRHILYTWGANNSTLQRYVLTFMGELAAAAAFAQLRAHPPKGYTASDPFYVAGVGAIVRTYFVRAGEPQRRVLAEVDGVVDGIGDLGSPEAAVVAYQAREVEWLAAGAMLATIEWSGARKRRSDLTVRQWIAQRVRDDGKTAAWHVEALDEIARYLASHQLAAPLETTLAPPATPDDIAAFAASRTHPVPVALDNLWRAIGGASWKLGERGMRLLAPLEVLARRPVARAAAEAYMAKLSPAAAEQIAPLVRSLDVLVETLAGKPATFVADIARAPSADDRVFTHAADHANDFWWEGSLGWMLATGFSHDLEDAIATCEPRVETLTYGQVPAGKAAKPVAKKKKKPVAKKPAAPKKKLAVPKKKPAPKKKPLPKKKPAKRTKKR